MIRWLLAARQDAARIYGYLIEHDRAAARKIVAKIYAAPQRLDEFPRGGRERPDIAPGLRSLSAGRYVILYRVVGEDVEIVRVLHSARDLASAFAADL